MTNSYNYNGPKGNTSSIPYQEGQASSYYNKYFDRYQNQEINFKPGEVDAMIGYFLKRGFEEISAVNISIILIKQATIDNIPAFQLIDTLKGLDNVQLSNVVAAILNKNRTTSSKIGFRKQRSFELFDERNIIV